MGFKKEGKFKKFSRDGDSGFVRKKEFVRRDAPSARGRLELFDAVCANCGKQTQVPFKPTQGKPVLCRECFKGDTPRDNSRPKRDDLAEIHEKLDKIMRALDIE